MTIQCLRCLTIEENRQECLNSSLSINEENMFLVDQMDDDSDVNFQDEENTNPSAARIDELERQLEEAQSLCEERFDQLMLCRADLDNLLKRSFREKEDTVRYASEKLVHKLLPVLDSIEQAATHDQGLKVLHMQLLGVLSSEGLDPIDAVGKKFDPYQHEALFQVKRDDLDEDIVAEEIQKGYTFNSRVIRFSKVAVNKHMKAEGCN